MEALVYRDGVDVPRDVTRVIVHPSVRVLPPKVFKDCEKLEEVQLNEGLQEIGDGAFYECVSLRRLNCPSTVLRIGVAAFMGCMNLEEIQLNEGIEEFRGGAFCCCQSLRRLGCPSTLRWIRGGAFAGCNNLEEVQLNEGLEKIGKGSFYDCWSLRRLDCPSTLVWIGARAFGACRSLSVVELAGILKVKGWAFAERRAFAGCHSLNRIKVPSRAFVVQRGNYPNLNYTTPDEVVLIAPECLTALPECNLTELGDSIDAIMNNGEGTEEDRLDRVRQEVRREVRGEVSAIIGLAFWKAKIDEAERVGISAVNKRCEDTRGTQEAREGCRREVEGKGTLFSTILGLAFWKAIIDKAERALMGAVNNHREDTEGVREAREGCRREAEGKGKLITQNVLPFLDGLWRNDSQGGP